MGSIGHLIVRCITRLGIDYRERVVQETASAARARPDGERCMLLLNTRAPYTHIPPFPHPDARTPPAASMPSVPLGFPFTMAVFDVHQLAVDPKTQLAHSMGAVLVGSLIALLYVPPPTPSPLALTARSLSGAVSMQVFLYFTLYPRDSIRIKTMVRAPAFLSLLDANSSFDSGLCHPVRSVSHTLRPDSKPLSG